MVTTPHSISHTRPMRLCVDDLLAHITFTSGTFVVSQGPGNMNRPGFVGDFIPGKRGWNEGQKIRQVGDTRLKKKLLWFG